MASKNNRAVSYFYVSGLSALENYLLELSGMNAQPDSFFDLTIHRKNIFNGVSLLRGRS